MGPVETGFVSSRLRDDLQAVGREVPAAVAQI